MANINIPLPPDLHKQLKLASLQQDTSLKEFIIQALDKKMRKKRGKH